MFRQRPAFVGRFGLLGTALVLVSVVTACADREPVGLGDTASQADVVATSTTLVRLPVRGQCAVDGTTGVALNAVTGALHHVPVLGSIATFNLEPGTYLFGWKKNLEANVQSQLSANKLLYFPYEVPNGFVPTPNANLLNCAAALLDPGLSNNTDYWNVETLNERLRTLGTATPHRSLVAVGGTGLTLNPMTLNNGLPDANLRCELTDGSGRTVPLSAARNIYRLQPLTDEVLELAEARRSAETQPPGIDNRRWEWYLRLRFAFLDVEAVVATDGTCTLQASDGLGFLELVDGRKTYLTAVRGVKGQSRHARLTEAEAVFNSYYFYGDPNATPAVRVGRAGWTLDRNGNASRDIQVVFNGSGEGDYRVRIDENPEPGAKNYRTTAYQFRCSAEGCVALSGKPNFYAVWSGGEGTLVLKHAGGTNTTNACVSVRVGNDVAPLADEGCAGFRDFGNGVYMSREIGKQGGGTWNIGI